MSDRYEWVDGAIYNEEAASLNLGSFYVRDKKTGVTVCVNDYIYKYARLSSYAISSVYANLENMEFWEFVCKSAPSACKHVPKKFQTPDLLRLIANNTSYDRNLRFMNMTLVEKWEGREAALDIYKTMVTKFVDALFDVPKDYWTDELVDIAINEHASTLSRLPFYERTDKRCIASVSKWGTTLRSVSNEKRNLVVDTADGKKSLCEIAVKVDGLALKYVPEEEKTFDLCLQACVQNIDAIVCVPPAILTPYFINSLVERGVELAAKHMTYAMECLKTYGKIDELLPLNSDIVSTRRIADNSSYAEIALDKLPLIVSKPILTKLEAKGITNLEELFTAYEREDFPSMFTAKTYAEISGIVNVLNCKFKDQDPMLDFSESSPDYMVSKLGLARKVANQMESNGMCVGKLIEQTPLPLEKQVWSKYLRGVGSGYISESLAKLFIFADYYDRHEKVLEVKENTLDEAIATLSKELEDLRRQREVLDRKIDATIAKMIELNREKSMSGGKPYVKKQN